MITPVEFIDYGGGDAACQTPAAKANIFVWRGIVKAGGADVNLFRSGSWTSTTSSRRR
jgi:hypothetical protein